MYFAKEKELNFVLEREEERKQVGQIMNMKRRVVVKETKKSFVHGED